MKRLLILTLIVLPGLGGQAVADSQPAVLPANGSPQGWRPASFIDGIEVPEEILLDAQMEHQGYAVVKALKSSRAGRTIYMLRLENGSNRQRGFYLLYDQSWQAVGREEIVVQAPPPAPEPPPLPVLVPVIEQPELPVIPEEPDVPEPPVPQPEIPEPQKPNLPEPPRRRR